MSHGVDIMSEKEDTATADGGEMVQQLVTPQEAATLKGVAVASIYKAIERGQLTAVRALGRVAIRVSDLDNYQPGSYGDVKRTYKPRGPGRPKTETAEGEASH